MCCFSRCVIRTLGRFGELFDCCFGGGRKDPFTLTFDGLRERENETVNKNWNEQGESDCLIKTKQIDSSNGCLQFVISAQCSECQRGEIQISAG